MPKQKGNGEGSFRKKGNGWEYRVTLENPNTYLSCQKSFTGKTKKECLDKRKQFELNGGTAVSSRLSLKDWSAQWLSDTLGASIDPESFKTYRSTLKRIQDDKIAVLKVKDVKPMHVQDFFNRHSNESRSYLKKWRSMLRSIFDYAIENDLCVKNPAKRINMPQGTVQERKIFDDSSIKTIEQFSLLDHKFGPCMLILMFSGVRAGEVVPLCAKNIDQDGVLHILGSQTADGRIVGDNKTKKHSGDLPLPDYATAYIRLSRKPDEYILHKEDGSSIGIRTFHTWYKQFFVRLNKWCLENGKDEVEFLTVHSTRHTYSTQLYRRGIDPVTTQNLMRHSSINMTGKYIHEDAQKKKDAVNIAFGNNGD